MTDDHKDAIRKGRTQANVVKAYLDSLGVDRRGRSSDPATLKKRLAEIEQRLDLEENKLSEIGLRQLRRDLQRALSATSKTTARDLEKEFIKVAKEFADRKRLSYGVFREMGVPPRVLAAAGMKRGS